MIRGSCFRLDETSRCETAVMLATKSLQLHNKCLSIYLRKIKPRRGNYNLEFQKQSLAYADNAIYLILSGKSTAKDPKIYDPQAQINPFVFIWADTFNTIKIYTCRVWHGLASNLESYEELLSIQIWLNGSIIKRLTWHSDNSFSNSSNWAGNCGENV